ncbi:MAG: NADH:ubiquinone reductase (Na(+)-transporting) subunit B [Myxococcota bacterium]
MQFLRKALDKQAHLFEKGGKLERLHPVWEAQDTILFTPGLVTRAAAHVRDALDQKRMMITVVFALIPCILMACFNTGYQANAAIADGALPLDDWHSTVYEALGLSFAAAGESVSFLSLSNFILGFLFFFPAWVITMTAGGISEVIFSVIRRHPVTEGFLVTGMLIPLIMPPSIPLWQVAVATIFGVVLGKEIFGGVGMNILNPALTARAFLFFAYPAQISGDGPWLPFDTSSVDAAGGINSLPDANSGATYLSLMANKEGFVEALPALGSAEWMNAFLGLIPGSMGETSALACLIGAGILIFTRIASWRTMLGIVLGTMAMALTLNAIGSDTNPMFAVPFWWHFVIGGWAFGAVFMATDPVSSPFSDTARFIYGLCIGVLVVLVRCVNPAYAEGMMLAILFMNMFAPLLDHFIVQANIRRRMKRSVA